MSEHEERALAEAYALGALDPPEKKLFEAHLGGCKICRDAVGGAALAANAIAFTAPKEAPPKGSGDRLVALYRQERAQSAPPASRGGGLGGTLAVVFALGALGVSGWGYFEHEKVSDLQGKVDALGDQIKKCHEEKAILDAKDVVYHVTWKAQNGFADTQLAIAHSPTAGVVVLGKNLPEPAEGKCYKLWSIATKNGKTSVDPMGAFKPGVFIDRSPGGADVKFAISEETDPNVPVATRVVLLPG